MGDPRPSVARDEYGALSFYGVLSVAWGAGNVLGAVIGLRWRPRRPMRTGFLMCAGWPVFNVLFGLGAPRAVVLASAVAAGVGLAFFIVIWETSLAQRIPPEALSRVSSYDWMGSLALVPIGYLGAGLIARSVDPATVTLVGGIGLFGLLALGLVPRETRELRRLEPETEPEPRLRASARRSSPAWPENETGPLARAGPKTLRSLGERRRGADLRVDLADRVARAGERVARSGQPPDADDQEHAAGRDRGVVHGVPVELVVPRHAAGENGRMKMIVMIATQIEANRFIHLYFAPLFHSPTTKLSFARQRR